MEIDHIIPESLGGLTVQGLPDRVAAWAAGTRRWFDSLIADLAAGGTPLIGYEITADAHSQEQPAHVTAQLRDGVV